MSHQQFFEGIDLLAERMNRPPRPLRSLEDEAVAQFSDLYWKQRAPWTKTFWRGVGVAKCPLDLWTYQEILWDTVPELVIETGSQAGGSANFFRDIMDGTGMVLTVDKDYYPARPEGPGFEYLTGDSLDPAIIRHIRAKAANYRRVMVVLDSLHTYEQVSAELAAYGHLVTPGCYLVVEDTNVDEAWGKPAAKQAAAEFVSANPGFVIDRTREKHLLTFNPDGWIKRER